MCNATAMLKATPLGILGSKLFGSDGGTPAVPPLQPTPVMPVMDSAAIAQERQKSVAKMMALGGRSSTILSQSSSGQPLGG